jgi:hypothetical protein
VELNSIEEEKLDVSEKDFVELKGFEWENFNLEDNLRVSLKFWELVNSVLISWIKVCSEHL